MSWFAETQSRMKSKLPACFAISFGVLRDDHFIGAQPQAVVYLCPGKW